MNHLRHTRTSTLHHNTKAGSKIPTVTTSHAIETTETDATTGIKVAGISSQGEEMTKDNEGAIIDVRHGSNGLLLIPVHEVLDQASQ